MTEDSDNIVIQRKKDAISIMGGLLQRKVQERTKIAYECKILEESIDLVKVDLTDYERSIEPKSND